MAILCAGVGAGAADRLHAQLASLLGPELATTRHSIRANGGTMSYTARVGLIPIRNNDAGEIRGHFGFVSYSLTQPLNAPPRPVTFVWNGGPGASSTTVHFVGFGPRRMKNPDDPARPERVTPELYDNDATWLEFTDLVFVDPVGTGFARPAKPEFAGEFFNTLGDLASTAEFIRLYLTRFDLLLSPVFLAGESYGTWRASGAAEALSKKGIDVAGVILISGGVQMGKVSPDGIRNALFVPGRTATAFYHKKLAPELMRDEQATLSEVRRWALGEYAAAWERRDSLSDAERDRVIAELARYTGVEPSAIDRKALAMTSPQFTAALLRDRNLTLGRYDMRVTSAAGPQTGSGEMSDNLKRNAVMIDYLRTTLQFKTDLTYQGLESGYSSAAGGRASGPGSRWNWNQGASTMASGDATAARAAASSVGSGDGPPGGSQPWLRRALILNPALRVFIAAGQYDSLNGCDDNDYLVAHVEPEFAKRMATGCYGGGHMMYDTKDARFKLKRDIAAFVKAAATPRR